MPDARPVIIGWKERVDFPEWKIRGLRMKMDTGARTSAIDARVVRELLVDGVKFVELWIAVHRRLKHRRLLVRAPLIGRRNVRTPGGEVFSRPVVETTIRLGAIEKRIALTVANRDNMIATGILGRFALADDFLVDSSRKFILGGK